MAGKKCISKCAGEFLHWHDVFVAYFGPVIASSGNEVGKLSANRSVVLHRFFQTSLIVSFSCLQMSVISAVERMILNEHLTPLMSSVFTLYYLARHL